MALERINANEFASKFNSKREVSNHNYWFNDLLSIGL